MRYRRQETLRYSFSDPPPARFKIIKVDNKYVHTSTGEGYVMDLSPGGMKLSTHLHIPLNSPIQLFVHTTIADVSLSFTADLVWAKQVKRDHHYGLDFIGDYEEEVISALKRLSPRNAE